ncbi:endothelin-converting enzyme 1-like [Dermacentor andersoni]|uniref:endothelin-converting enzyme 1-like n=1 Tax=Dermacentor andersoni TaxID=34620 RepID=UPI003B3A7FB9
MYDGIHTFTNDSQVIVKNRPFFESFVSYIGSSSKHRRGALNYLGFFLLIYLMPLFPEELAKDRTLIGAKVHSPKDMSRRPQICMRRTEFTCPYGIPSLLAHVLANSTSLSAVTQNLTWWIDDLKGVMKRFAGSIHWLDEEETKLVKEKITNMQITFIFPDMFLKAKPNIKDLKCGYKPDLYKQDPITHFIKAMFTGANASKSELKTKQPRPMIPVVSNFEFSASYNPEENSLYAPMGLFGQILYAKSMEEKIFYTFKALPDIIREMSKVFMKRSFLSAGKLSWSNTTGAKYADVERCMFDFYKDTVSDITFEVAEKSMEDLLESLLVEAVMFRPLQESQCEASKPINVTKEVLIQLGVPGRIRLTRSISALKDFSEAFNCNVTQPMTGFLKFTCSIYEDKGPEHYAGILF